MGLAPPLRIGLGIGRRIMQEDFLRSDQYLLMYASWGDNQISWSYWEMQV
jgi:hypothetical protein